ncbi:hypothetical protein [Spiroplasma citri]|uniref:hypothetical protein n=1 Tax=Spiroplasma citri TaxID=2133 RepID=UPI00286F8CEE|nr:hypothetical protein [Spiroplasma citri]
MKSWELAWNKAVSENKKNEFFDFSYEKGISKTDEEYDHIQKIYKISGKQKMDYNGNLVSVFIDNYDNFLDIQNGKPKKSLLIPLFFDGYYYHLIRLTTKIPNKNEKNYIKIPPTPDTKLKKECYARLDRKDTEIRKMEKWRLEKYTIINCSKINYIYRKEILEKCFNSPHIQEIYHIFLKEELKKIEKEI